MSVTAKYQRVVQPFEPIYNKNSKVLILGSFPSVKSREMGFYYGHKQNRFWKVLANILEVEEPVTVEEKKDILLKHGIAVYDVIESCDIKGSSDSSIKNVVPADIRKIVAESDIQVVVTNGRTADRMFQKYQSNSYKGVVLTMPSTSPANAAFSLERLVEIWRAGLKEYL
ncbi:MAG: DNA-deoxyinosine glycosylase [Lachnospiraceae bacterium]|nr:DNA-deoxyinosine glycosylase [Lachnospiraceae bacterium]